MNKKVNSFQEHKQKEIWKDLSCLDKKQFDHLKINDWFCKKYYGDTIEEYHEKKISNNRSR